MTDSFWAATRSDTAVLMLAASDGPDLDDVLTVLVRHEPDYVLVTVAGEVDFASAAGLRERLFTLASAGRPLVADLDRVSFIDAAGLGVQVLFGFLLSLPFTNRFDQLSHGQRNLYLATLVLAAVATALLLGPVAYHRLVFRQGEKERLVRAANVMAIAGLATVGLAVSAAILLVTGYVSSGLTAALITAFVTLLFAGLWFALPLARRR